MKYIGIVGGGPTGEIPNLRDYDRPNMIWIGADKGTLSLLEQGIVPNTAIGDFDSLTENEFNLMQTKVKQVKQFQVEKDETDIELAINLAISLKPEKIFLFGVTGGRLDHELINLQLLFKLEKIQIPAVIINKLNWIELKLPNLHTIEYDPNYKYISFIPQSKTVKDLTLEGFYYPLKNHTIKIGSSKTVSNYLIGKKGTFSFSQGILLVIKSHDGRQ